MMTAKRFLPPHKPSRWSPEEHERMNAPISEESRFLAHARQGRNLFLTGMAGTGKSTLLKQFIGQSPRRVDITAPTGVAALNVGGMTIHRFCGMLLGPQAGQSNDEYFEQLRRDPRRSILAGFNRVRRCEVLVSYAIGVAQPTSITVETFGTGRVSDGAILKAVREVFDLRPGAIIRDLDLRRPIYQATASYGHFGRTDLGVPWEDTGRASALKAAAGL